ncbi:MAG: M6 family metalloprotease domain-containing protein [Prevotella sp.]|nr:M6 family metalloprotease domain-containing protein [Prevotella sp.]
MKKSALLLLFCFISIVSYAAKANGEPMTFTQSDGTEITVHLYGDEHFSWYATLDGVLLVRTGNDFFIADVDADGELTPTAVRAHDLSQRSAAEHKMVLSQHRDRFFSRKAELRREAIRRREPLGNATPHYFPHTGSPTAIVILVNFADTTFVVDDPVKTFEQYLNGDEQLDYGHGENRNICSVRQYFETCSFGQFSPKFKVVGPVTVSKGMAYYGANVGNTKDKNYKEMLTEACNLANEQELIDFADPAYDSDNDGDIDLVYFVYAGYGESNGGGDNTIWPKSSTTNITLSCGKNIRRFGLNNELNARWGHKDFKDENGRPYKHINGIGLFCHEFSHTMGLPDLYPNTESAQVNNQEMENWSLMDGGEYVDYGYKPAAYTAWEREVVGWHEIETLSTYQHIDLKTIDDGGKAYKMLNPANSAEYIVIENIQQKGLNQGALGHGLLAYHVAWPSKTVNMSDRPNNTKDYPRMAVIPADGLLFSAYLQGTQEPWGTGRAYKRDDNGNYVLDENGNRIIIDHVVTKEDYEAQHAGDPFPGKENVTSLEWKLSLPNYVWYTPAKEDDANNEEYVASKKYPVYQVLRNISEDVNTGTVSFDFYDDFTTEIKGASLMNEEMTKNSRLEIYDLQGRHMADNAQLLKGIYIIKGKKVVIR